MLAAEMIARFGIVRPFEAHPAREEVYNRREKGQKTLSRQNC